MDNITENPEIQNGLKHFEQKVLNNFFWSFHHSQGNPTLQTLISIYSARQYDAAKVGSIEDFEARLKSKVEKFKIPGQHLAE